MWHLSRRFATLTVCNVILSISYSQSMTMTANVLKTKSALKSTAIIAEVIDCFQLIESSQAFAVHCCLSVVHYTFIAKFGRRHEDLFNPENSCRPEGKSRGRHEFSGLNKSSCLPTNWVINCLFYRKLEEHLLSRNVHRIKVLHTLAFHS